MADLSPAAELRAAAQLIRERGAGATAGPWQIRILPARMSGLQQYAETHMVRAGDVNVANADRVSAPHIAGMHPGVALAVADLLEATSTCECEEGDDHADIRQAALAIARAYLEGDTP